MRRKHLYVLILLILTSAKFLYGQGNELKYLINMAISVSPRIKMLDTKKDIKAYKIPQVSNLPDPILTIGLRNMPTNSFSFTQDPMTQKIIGLKQTIPFPGKLSANEDVASIDTLIILQEIKDAKNEIRKNVKKKYYELSFIRRAIILAGKSKNLLKNISEIVSTKYTVGSASQQNLLKVMLEITNINDKLEKLKGREEALKSELKAILFFKPTDKIQTPFYKNLSFTDINELKIDSLTKANRPYLKGVQFGEEKSKLQQISAEKDFYPNFSLGLQYSLRDRLAATGTQLHDLFSVVIGISLPINYGGKKTAKIEEAISYQKFYSHQYSLALQTLKLNFGSKIARLNSLKERITLFKEGLLPQARQNLTATLSHYQVGHIDFINVIDAQDDLFKIETNLYRLTIDYKQELAELEFLSGTELE